MKGYRYSRWDGEQEAFSLDPRAALDALSDRMMEGLTSEEALDWMRRHGFPLAGMDMPVLGSEDLQSLLREEARSLYERYDLSDVEADLQRRLDEILDREETGLRDRHGFESARLNDFLDRRHRPEPRTSQRVEAFRDFSFEDSDAAEDFAELLAELDRMRSLEDFLDREAGHFRGSEPADYETAQEIRERLEELQQLAQALETGRFDEISAERLQDLLGDAAGGSFVLLRDLESGLRDAGYLSADGTSLTPRAIRRIGSQALVDVYSALRKQLGGEHESPGRGVSTPRPDETRAWEFGDSLDLDLSRTVLNAVKRQSAGGRPPGSAVSLGVEDFEVRERDFSTQTTTVLLLDMSWSMSWEGRFPAAKRVALAMDQLIRSQFPRDHFFVVGFSTRARELRIRELPEVSWDMGDPFTNLQEGLMVAERLIRQHPSASPQIIVITDGQPTAYFEDSQLRVEWPMGYGGVSPRAVASTLQTVRRVTRMGVTINSFMLDDAPELVGFVERMTEINKGRAFYTQPSQLGSFLMVDYVSRRRSRRGR